MANAPDTHHYWRINEIKNAIYCPRIPYYAMCLELDRETAVSRIGILAEADTKQRMRRRKHALHAVVSGARHFDVEIIYHPLRLVGRLDEVIETDEGVYLVDYKDTDTDYGYWRVQMAAYRLGMRAAGLCVQGCYIYTIPDQTYHKLTLTKRHDTQLHQVIEQLRGAVDHEITPPHPTLEEMFNLSVSALL